MIQFDLILIKLFKQMNKWFKTFKVSKYFSKSRQQNNMTNAKKLKQQALLKLKKVIEYVQDRMMRKHNKIISMLFIFFFYCLKALSRLAEMDGQNEHLSNQYFWKKRVEKDSFLSTGQVTYVVPAHPHHKSFHRSC